MRPLVVSLIAFGCIFGGTLLGMGLRGRLPQHHLSEESKEVLKLGIGMIATLSALVLGLLIASAKGNFDRMNTGFVDVGSKILLFDRLMAHYGPETKEARGLLRGSLETAVDQLWAKEGIKHGEANTVGTRGSLEAIQHKLLQLAPQNETQRWLRSQALQVSGEISQVRWLLIEQKGLSSLPMPFFVMLVSWITIIFFGFGLLSPRNATVVAVLLLCVLSASGSLYMILELDQPYGGLIEISSAPLRNAISLIGK